METHPPTDSAALREKYRQEREKRLRPEGKEQYIQPTGKFASLLKDPYGPATEREPVDDEVTVAVIGGGFSGMCTGAKLKIAGVKDVRIIEAASDFGGVWYWNRYPGAMCDTAAMIYLPMLEETGYLPSMKYVFAPEIFDHARRIAKKYDLYDNALLSADVNGLKWDEDSARWIITTRQGDTVRARFVSMGTGPLHRPKLPGIEGIETYEGHCFHTSRWDYDYTGGGPDIRELDKLSDKRVGIIGTGATAIQAIPRLSESAKELFVFQRTPSSIDVRGNHPIDPKDYDLHPGWQKEWLVNFATLQTGGFADKDLVKDGWTDIAQRIRDRVVDEVKAGATPSPETIRRAYEDSDDEKMNEIRARVDAIVQDEATAQALKPWYRQLCKRPCFHDEYLQAYNHEGTHLIDTDGKGVERIDETGCWVGGKHYELDCIIFASGFEVGTEYARRSGYETVGRDGETLSQHWEEGMRTMHGMHVRGFPNLFIVSLTQAGNLISNITHNLTEAGESVAAVIKHALDTDSKTVEVSQEAEDAWVKMIDHGRMRILGNTECTPGYYNNEGRPMGRRERLNGGGYPHGPVAYFEYIDKWRKTGDFEGLEFA